MLIQPTRGAGVFTRLIGQPLCAVTFIWDYYQALIGNETLSIFTHPKVTVGDRIMLVGMPGYRDALCGRIGKRTVGFDRRREQVSLRFDDGSLRLDDALTGRSVDFGAFGPSNFAAFARLMPEPGVAR